MRIVCLVVLVGLVVLDEGRVIEDISYGGSLQPLLRRFRKPPPSKKSSITLRDGSC